MPKSRPQKRGTAHRGRPRTFGKENPSSPLSLPPAGTGSDPSASPSAIDVPVLSKVPPAEVPERPHWLRADNSVAHERALKIVMRRLEGIEDEAIARELGISLRTLYNTMYLAGKNNWITFENAKEAIAYGLAPKVVAVLEEGLQDETRNEKTGIMVKQHIALEVAHGTIFKQFDQQSGAAPTTVIGIKIETVPGPPQQLREGTMAAAPAYVEGELAQ